MDLQRRNLESQKLLASRRTILGVGAGLVAASTLGCTPNKDEMQASAARGSDRVAFRDTVAWFHRNSASVSIALVPFMMTKEQKDAVLAYGGVEPTLGTSEKMLEVRIDLKDDRASNRIVAEHVDQVRLTFWHFDEPPAVFNFKKDSWKSPEIELINVDGEARAGGFLIGTLRSQALYQAPRGGTDAYSVNLGGIALSLV
ncbi:hypothetical protein BOSEA31B_20379 [Hyphomicrobiales bacterium]|nr:hypothetical protein BOSEA31B_20379 [Hyphomicrobiales bacterium]CAH1702245.1 conserved hypothetical protein [Hyphomicrobiales bacterium]CAI0346448.1 hypothetical protein BO1005MUT1_510089 [Hyphomicrobiales bacterium]